MGICDLGNNLSIGIGNKSREDVEKELVPENDFERMFKTVKEQFL
jgi:hypothetical protein